MTMSASHNTILLTSAPMGRFLEGILNTACYPGTNMEVDAAVEPIGGKHTWQASSLTTGQRQLLAILLENEMVGKTCSDQIADEQKIRMYCPIPGDELLVLVSASGTGTGDAQAIGDILIRASGGTFIATTGTPEQEPFQVMETMTDVTSTGTLTHVMATGT